MKDDIFAIVGTPDGLHLEYTCECGKTHLLILDASGHFSGMLPCGLSRINLQADPQTWRQICEWQSENKVH